MKIERISETQIRCVLNKKDLSDRQIGINELAYGTDKTNALFEDMMQQAFCQFGFETNDNIPLMIEAIPFNQDCLVLNITKVDNPDELDTRFSKFTVDSDFDDNAFDNEAFDNEAFDNDAFDNDAFDNDAFDNDAFDNDAFNNKTSDNNTFDNKIFGNSNFQIDPPIPEGAEIIDISTLYTEEFISKCDKSRFYNPHPKSLKDFSDVPAGYIPISDTVSISKGIGKDIMTPVHSPDMIKIFSFNSLAEISRLSHVIVNMFFGESSIYKDPTHNKYYLIICKIPHTPKEFSKICNVISEYGAPVSSMYATEAYIFEHYDVILTETAIHVLSVL